MSSLLAFITTAVLVIFTAADEGVVGSDVQYVKNIASEDFHRFTKGPSVTIVYFFKTDQNHIQNFLKEYEKSAELLQLYNVELGKVICPAAGPPHGASEYCDEDGVEDNVYAFRDGHELLALALENAFDVNSILSNILQIVLLREVPILQTYTERREFEDQNKGKSDIIFSYQTAIGTYEHRVLMEVAFAYHMKYKFAVTTEKAVIHDLVESGTGERSMIWVLQCKSTVDKAPCAHSKYHDSIHLISLARFLKVLNIDLIHDIGTQAVLNPFEEHKLHTVVIYYDEAFHSKASDLAEHLQSVFHGVVGILLVDVKHPDAQDFGYIKGITHVPGVSVYLGSTTEPVVMVGEVTTQLAEIFLAQQLDTVEWPGPTSPPEETYTDESKEHDLLADVEKQDDQVAESVAQLQHIEPDRTYIPALTDKTFPIETKTRDLLVVFFHATFDAVSTAFMRSYIDASHVLAKESLYPLAGVDCFDWTDVCSRHNVSSYPTLLIYRKGKDPMKYQGGLGASPIITLVKLLLVDAPVYLPSHQEAALYIQGRYPALAEGRTLFTVIGLFDNGHKNELAAFKQAALEAHGRILFGYTSPDATTALCSQFSTQPPSVVVYRRTDPLRPYQVYKDEMTPANILHFVDEVFLPTFPEITTQNFPALFARGQPFVILFDENIKEGSGAHQQVAAVAQSEDFPDLTFGWMELTRDDGVAGKVLLEYDQLAEPPALFIVNHQKGVIYHFSRSDWTSDVLTTWLSEVQRDKVTPWKMMAEGEWRPLNPGYDFLKMIDQENAEEANQRAAERNDPAQYVESATLAADEQAEMKVRRELRQIRDPPAEGVPNTEHTEL